ncbi:hypothetical protein BH09MYX1_BH09MYX1_12230 [soil metagenome]
MRIDPAPTDAPLASFRRGKTRPRAIAWFGFTAFWGHLRHLVASAIATENIDSRQWMVPEPADVLLERCLAILGEAGAVPAPTLVQAMGGEVWVDCVADTGYDVTVSEAVANLVAREYELADGTRLPRGQVLLLGGDLAYPVATVREVTRRLVEPWNRVFEEADDGIPRLLLAVPGNHDWYDGLDGFARLCQAPCDFERPVPRRETLYPVTSEHPVLSWVEAFSRGEAVRKPDALSLYGYFPAQRTSYFRLPLARSLDLWGVDRQLRQIDVRQRDYFRSAPRHGRLIVLPDPARAWGEKRPHGVASLDALDLRPESQKLYVLSGDIHHYERSDEGASVHVVAGGGGAFLQGARIAKGARYRIDVEFPGPKASSKMLRELPLHVASGGAGWLVVCIFGALEAVALWAHLHGGIELSVPVATVIGLIVTISTVGLIGWRRHRKLRIIPFATSFGALIAALPLTIGVAVDQVGIAALGPTLLSRIAVVLAAWLAATFATGAAFGAMLAVLARLGLNHAQPFAALGLPTHTHVVRMRVRETASETAIDTFVIGQVDPVGKSPTVLVDRFTWSARVESA